MIRYWLTIVVTDHYSGREHNFNKYDNRTVTDYGIGYDYDSIMHYSSYAFSKNGEPTITPKVSKLLHFFRYITFFIRSYKLYRRKTWNLANEKNSVRKTRWNYEKCTRKNVANERWMELRITIRWMIYLLSGYLVRNCNWILIEFKKKSSTSLLNNKNNNKILFSLVKKKVNIHMFCCQIQKMKC